jgi:hypothetical protein
VIVLPRGTEASLEALMAATPTRAHRHRVPRRSG